MESSAFASLHPKVQRWIWRTGWSELRDIQESSIPAILSERSDLVIAAATASGKTEAAFLPILSALADDSGGSIRALCVSPLRALINDQFNRLEELCEDLGVPVNRWHGDVGSTRKRAVLDAPAGVLIITPESLEALFVLRGSEIARLFARLAFVVVDELHVFIGSERGMQLQSLLHRVELAIRRRVPRIGLSATLGDLDLACRFLRPGTGDEVLKVESTAGGQELKLQVRGYRHLPPRLAPVEVKAREASGETIGREDVVSGDVLAIGRHLFEHLRGGHHLIFANARRQVEELADLLRRLCEREGLPNEFWPHHGSLSKELREEAEAAIKDRARPASAVCTTTLELGIDVGAIESVAQVGSPPSVASLRQRLGRSGRSGGPAVLRVFVREPAIDPATPPHATLRIELVETVAMIDLLLAGWCESPDLRGLHLSTLVQQVLSQIAQHGAVRADEAWRSLCGGGPFSGVDQGLFSNFLRSLGAKDLIQQDHSGELVLADIGEKIVNHYSFFSAFTTPEEYRLIASGEVLGSLPISYSVFPGLHIIFGGRRWVVLAVDDNQKVIELKPSSGGRPPRFSEGRFMPVHDRVRLEMLRVYRDAELPRYLDASARDLLGEGRENYYRLRLHSVSIVPHGDAALFFPWRGDRVMDTLVVWWAARGIEACREGVALAFPGFTPTELRTEIEQMARTSLPEPVALAKMAKNQRREKFHGFLGDDELALDYAATVLDLEGAAACLRALAGEQSGRES
jgi:ATP-dependent helicase Lhr and Lhr-like helicase